MDDKRLARKEPTEVPAGRRSAILATLRSHLAQLLGMQPSEIDVYAPLLEIGVDSLFLVEALRAIEKEFGLRIAVRQIFEELATLDALAGYIADRRPPEALPAAASGEEPVGAAPAAAAPAGPDVSDMLRQLEIMREQLEGLRSRPVVTAPDSPKVSEPPGATGGTPARDSLPPWRSAPTPTSALSRKQREYLDEFSSRFTGRTRTSKELAGAWRPVLADNRASAGFRFSTKELLYPIVGKRSDGARIWDVDDNEYVDITMGFGVHLFGHQPPFITAAIREQLEAGLALGPQSRLAGEVAAAIRRLTGKERVTFCNTGTEAVMTALRLARTASGLDKIAIFSGSYHGHFDGTLVAAADGQARSSPIAPGVTSSMAADVLVLEYGSPRALELVRQHAHELAAVLVEPVQSRRPDFQPRDFLLSLRADTREKGVALIFDEMITGFRVHPGGAQAWFGVEADIATYGKVIGGGMPIGVVAGRSHYLDGIDGGQWSYGDATYPRAKTTFFAGTFSKHPLAMAAARASLAYIEANGQALQELNRRTADLARRLNACFVEEQVPIQVVYFGSLFRFHFERNLDLFFYLLLAKGVYVWEGRNCFLSTAHGDDEIEFIVRAVQEAVRELRAGGFLPSPAVVIRSLRAVPEPSSASASPPASEPMRSVTAQAEADPQGPERGRSFWDRKRPQPAVRRADSPPLNAAARRKAVDFSLFYFGNYPAEFSPHKYDLLIEGAKFADAHGFSAVWVPERHFHAFGGLSPNPSVLCAALASITSRVQLRAGSVVLPIHHPIRVAEEWAVVDNLSKGRVGVSFASGWHPDDFVFAPQAFGKQREIMFEGIDTVRRLWRGEPVQAKGGAGQEHAVGIFPMPMQPELPTWITIVNNTDTYRQAGAMGARVLTNLMDQTLDALASNVAVYREALAQHGHDSALGHVTVLVHTFLGADLEAARDKARRPFCHYLEGTLGLFSKLVKRQGLDIDVESLTAEDREYLLGAAYERYVQTTALIGTVDSSRPIVDQLVAAGADEIACFVDFGVDRESVLESLRHVDALRKAFQAVPAPATSSTATEAATAAAPVQPPLPGGARSADRTAVAPTDASAEVPSAQRFPLTEAQEHLWVLASLGGDAALTYNMHVSLRLRGRLKRQPLKHAIQKIVDRHEALRTRFSRDGDYQYVQPALTAEIREVDFVGAPQGDAKVSEWFAREARRPFDLMAGPLCRFSLLRLEEELHLLVLSIHHIIVDGWSIGVLARELGEFYSAACRSEECRLPAPVQYREYIDWQRKQRDTEEMASHEAYWLRQFSPPLPVLNLPTDHPRPPLITFRGGRRTRLMEPELRGALNSLARANRCTLYMVLMSAFAALLHRLSRQADIIVSVPLADRSLEGSESLVGYCANQLAIRSRIEGDPTFIDYLSRMRGLLLDAYEHQDYPYARLLNGLLARRESSVLSPLHAVIFNFNPPVGAPPMGGLQIEWLSEHINWVADELAVHLTDLGGHLTVDCEYNAALFEGSTVDRLIDSYLSVLRGVVAEAGRPLSALPILTEEQQQLLLVEWNRTDRAFPTGLVHELFDAQVARNPDAVAAVLPGAAPEADQCVTYRELQAHAEAIARRLRTVGAGPDVLVGICADRSLELLAGLLGTLKAGAAYVPLDPSYPDERLAHMLSDSRLGILLVGEGLEGRLPSHEGAVLPLKLDWPGDREAAGPVEPTPSRVGADALAYVIYTSGSTGKPKGVAVTHGSLANFLRSMAEEPGLTDADVLVSVTSPSFDIAALELFLPLTVGARVIIAPTPVTADGPRLRDLVHRVRATVMQATPSTWKLLLAAGFDDPRLTALCGGEALANGLAQRLAAKVSTLYNLYGPTEGTIWATLFKVGEGTLSTNGENSIVPIGRPIANTRVYILDEHGGPVPIGVPGELYIGGLCLARGYLGQPGMTADRFIPDPFAGGPGGRLYRTGDLARFASDGTIIFLGRLDNQVKVRGFRVEMGEIEAVLALHPGLSEALVTALDDAQEKRLVAYVIPRRHDHAPSADELRRWLRGRLPDYMVPGSFTVLEAFPLTSNGKIDPAALPRPQTGQRNEAIVQPRDALERELQAMWEEVLDVRPVGIRDDFFELGGHSFLAVRLVAKIQQRFQKSLPLAVLFVEPTIERAASFLRQDSAAPAVPAASASPLVAIQPKGHRTPFFCVHPAGGQVVCYVELARRLSPERPFYALQFPDSAGEAGASLATVEGMAACYIDALRAVQPHGPYQLGGWSVGGVIAFEMAQRLSREGEEISALALIDSFAPVAVNVPDDVDEVEAFVRVARDLAPLFRVDFPVPVEDWEDLEEGERLQQLVAVTRHLRIVPPDADSEEVRHTLKLFQKHLVAFSRYRPRPYDGRITLFSACRPVALPSGLRPAAGTNDPRERLLEFARDAHHGWSSLVGGGIDLIEIPTDHYSIVHEPFVGTVGDELEARLDTHFASSPPRSPRVSDLPRST